MIQSVKLHDKWMRIRPYFACVLVALLLVFVEAEADPVAFSDALGRCSSRQPGARRLRIETDPTPRFPGAERLNVVQAVWLRQALARLPREKKLPKPWPCDHPMPVSDVQALAAPDQTIVHCCGAYDADNGWPQCVGQPGCEMIMPCSYFVATTHGWVRAETEEQRSALFGPIRSEAQALGRLALAEAYLLLEQRVYHEHGTEPPATVVVPAATRIDADFQFEVPFWDGFSCHSPMLLRTYRISPAGEMSEVKPRQTLILPNTSWCFCTLPVDHAGSR